jgi:hypothetical protein
MSCLLTEDEDELKSLPSLRDLVELKKIGWSGKYRFVRVLERARLQRFEFLLSDPETQAKALEPILSRVIQQRMSATFSSHPVETAAHSASIASDLR